MKRIVAGEWEFYTPEGKGEQRSVLLDLNGWDGVEIDIRSSSPVELRTITDKGNTLFLDWGQTISFSGKLVGFAALEVVANNPFAFRARKKAKFLEVPDPKRLVVAVDESSAKPMQDLVRQELLKYLGRASAMGALKDDVSVEELLDDIESGDLDFEAEPEMFGIGHAEMPPLEPEAPAQPVPAPAASSSAPPDVAVTTNHAAVSGDRPSS